MTVTDLDDNLTIYPKIKNSSIFNQYNKNSNLLKSKDLLVGIKNTFNTSKNIPFQRNNRRVSTWDPLIDAFNKDKNITKSSLVNIYKQRLSKKIDDSKYSKHISNEKTLYENLKSQESLDKYSTKNNLHFVDFSDENTSEKLINSFVFTNYFNEGLTNLAVNRKDIILEVDDENSPHTNKKTINKTLSIFEKNTQNNTARNKESIGDKFKLDDTRKKDKDKIIEDSSTPQPAIVNSPIQPLQLTNFDLEDMDYDDLLIYEKRNIFRYYYITLIDEHILLTAFFKHSLLLPRFIRISLMIHYFSMEFALNALFYSDEYISKRYKVDEEQVINVFNNLF